MTTRLTASYVLNGFASILLLLALTSFLWISTISFNDYQYAVLIYICVIIASILSYSALYFNQQSKLAFVLIAVQIVVLGFIACY